MMKTLYPIVRRKRRPLILEEGSSAAVPAIGQVMPLTVTPQAVERGLGEAVVKATQRVEKADRRE